MKNIRRVVAMIACLASSAWGQASAPSNPTGPAPCATPESRQFDFWLGTWEVLLVGKKTSKVADSVIEKTFMDCAVVERRTPLAGGGGESLNAYVPEKSSWRQVWLGASGGFLDSWGGWNGKAMVIVGELAQPDGKSVTARQTYTPQVDGTVLQIGEMSGDGGKTWNKAFEFIYRHPGNE